MVAMVSYIRNQFREVESFINETILDSLNWSQLSQAVAGFLAFNKQEDDAAFFILPSLVYASVGGNIEQAVPLSASWILLQLASQLFDDLQDQDHKQVVWMNWPQHELLKAGLGAIFAGQSCLSYLTAPDDDATAVTDILHLFANAGLLAAHAQATEHQIATINDYFQNLIKKASVLFSVGAQTGARFYTTDVALRNAFHEFGMAVGTLIQIRDDIRDISPQNKANDLLAYRHALPVLHGLSQVSHPGYPQLAHLVQEKKQLGEEQLTSIYQILIEMGSLDFCASIMHVYQQKAVNALSVLKAQNSIHLINYVSSLYSPVSKSPHSSS